MADFSESQYSSAQRLQHFNHGELYKQPRKQVYKQKSPEPPAGRTTVLEQHSLQEEIAKKRDRLVELLEKRMQQKTTVTPVFAIRWKVI